MAKVSHPKSKALNPLSLSRAQMEQEGQQALPRMERRLNPDAREWDILRDRGSEEQRCLYLTFSKGFPLYEHEIARFFNE